MFREDLDSTPVFPSIGLFLLCVSIHKSQRAALLRLTLFVSFPQEDAKIKKKFRQKYKFDDQGRNLRNREFNLTVVWNIMPRVGECLVLMLVVNAAIAPGDHGPCFVRLALVVCRATIHAVQDVPRVCNARRIHNKMTGAETVDGETAVLAAKEVPCLSH